MNIVFPRVARRLVVCLAIILTPASSLGADDAVRSFDIPADHAEKSLRVFSAQSGVQVIFPSDAVKDVTTKAVKGDMLPGVALDQLLSGTRLVAVQESNGGAFTVRRETSIDAAEKNGAGRTSSPGLDAPAAKTPPPRKSSADANAKNTGTVVGRVQNSAAGLYLKNARVVVAGTNVQALTNEFGDYRLSGVPGGDVTLIASYAGLAPQSAVITVSADARVEHDFFLIDPHTSKPSTKDHAVMLDTFVVATARETNASAIAVNEQRVGASIKNVLATDALGEIAQNNIGEFMKYIPGVEVVYSSMNADGISVRGLPSTYTEIRTDGMAESTGGGMTRNTTLRAISITNVQRIEVSKVPTPDQSAASLGGSVNLIPRTAFEYSRPEFNFRAYLNMNSHWTDLRKTTGWDGVNDNGKTFKTGTDWDFSSVAPLGKQFGISVSASQNTQFVQIRRIVKGYGTGNTPAGPAAAANPYTNLYRYQSSTYFDRRYGLAIKADWKVSQRDTLSGSFSGGILDANNDQHLWQIGSGAAPLGWGPTFVHGAAGQGNVTYNNNPIRANIHNQSWRLNYRHLGENWDWDAAAGYNKSVDTRDNNNHGYFSANSYTLSGLSVDMDGQSQYLPGTLTVRNAAGQMVDPFSYADANLVLGSQVLRSDTFGISREVAANLKRKFSTRFFDGGIKAGVMSRREEKIISIRRWTPVYAGPDGILASGDEKFANLPGGAASVLNAAYSSLPGPRDFNGIQYVSSTKLYDLYKAHPDYFQYPATSLRADTRASYTDPQEMTERVDATYAMINAWMLRRRLRVVTGVRYERTSDEGRGFLQDNSAQYQRDPVTGKIRLNASNQPIPLTTDPLAADALIYKRLGARLEKTYGDYYPSLNTTFLITENFLFRLGWAKTLGRPNYSNIVPTATITEVTNHPDDAVGTALGSITAKNPALKPWTGHNYDLMFEYYTKSGGTLTAGVYRKDINHFFGSQQFNATPEYLESVKLPLDYENYRVTYPINLSDPIRITGYELSADQSLKFARGVARYFSVFANVSSLRIKGNQTEANLRGFSPLSANWGLRFNKRPVALNLKFNFLGHRRLQDLGLITNYGNDRRSAIYQPSRLRLDASLDYQLTRHLTAFVSGRNILNDRNQQFAYQDGSPGYVKFNNEEEYGVTFQVGIKGRF